MTEDPISNGQQTVNIIKDYTTNFKPVKKSAFAEFIREKRKEYNEDHGKNISTDDLGNMIGIKYEMFRKILNQEKPTKKRDCIIAICAALQLLPGEIDEALLLYQYMPALSEDNPRDNFIIAQICGNEKISVQELNTRLLQRGFQGLDIHDKRDGKAKRKESALLEYPYKVLDLKVRTPVDADHYFGDIYDSLCTTYDPYRFNSTGDMIIGDLKEKRYVHLIANTAGSRSAITIGGDYSSTTFNSLDETGVYKNYFIELENALSLEKRRLLGILNDTKNYQERTSAKLIGDAICVFTEQFNYIIPELNEYFVLSLTSGRYQLFVYNCSAFMSWYLSKEDYKLFYETELPEPKEMYDSLSSLDELINDTEINSSENLHYRIRKDAFEKLQTTVDTMYQQLKDRNRFIQNLEQIFDDPAESLRYYNLEKDFECKYDEEYGVICDCLESKDYQLSDGTLVTVTLSDIFRAFEYGFPNIDEICRIKSKYGSIDAVMS